MLTGQLLFTSLPAESVSLSNRKWTVCSYGGFPVGMKIYSWKHFLFPQTVGGGFLIKDGVTNIRRGRLCSLHVAVVVVGGGQALTGQL